MKFKPKLNGCTIIQLPDTHKAPSSSLHQLSHKVPLENYCSQPGGGELGENFLGKNQATRVFPVKTGPVVAVLQEHRVSSEPDGFGPSQTLVRQRVGLTSAEIKGSLPVRRPLGRFGLATIFFWFVCFNHSQAASILQSCVLLFLLQTQQLNAQTNLSHQRSIMPSNKQTKGISALSAAG